MVMVFLIILICMTASVCISSIFMKLLGDIDFKIFLIVFLLSLGISYTSFKFVVYGVENKIYNETKIENIEIYPETKITYSYTEKCFYILISSSKTVRLDSNQTNIIDRSCLWNTR
jgi:hypothetical protein